VHVKSAHAQIVAMRELDHVGDLRVPDAVLARLSAGVHLARMSVTEARVHAQRHAPAGTDLRVLLDHEVRAQIDRHVVTHDRVDRARVEEIGSEHDLLGREARRETARDLAR
jgi:hypothetical protein